MRTRNQDNYDALVNLDASYKINGRDLESFGLMGTNYPDELFSPDVRHQHEDIAGMSGSRDTGTVLDNWSFTCEFLLRGSSIADAARKQNEFASWIDPERHNMVYHVGQQKLRGYKFEIGRTHWYEAGVSLVNNSDATVFGYQDRYAVDSGTATSDVTNQLIDTGQNFLSTVKVGDVLINTTDTLGATVIGIIDDETLLLSADACPDGNESYNIYRPIYWDRYLSPDSRFEVNGDNNTYYIKTIDYPGEMTLESAISRSDDTSLSYKGERKKYLRVKYNGGSSITPYGEAGGEMVSNLYQISLSFITTYPYWISDTIEEEHVIEADTNKVITLRGCGTAGLNPVYKIEDTCSNPELSAAEMEFNARYNGDEDAKNIQGDTNSGTYTPSVGFETNSVTGMSGEGIRMNEGDVVEVDLMNDTSSPDSNNATWTGNPDNKLSDRISNYTGMISLWYRPNYGKYVGQHRENYLWYIDANYNCYYDEDLAKFVAQIGGEEYEIDVPEFKTDDWLIVTVGWDAGAPSGKYVRGYVYDKTASSGTTTTSSTESFLDAEQTDTQYAETSGTSVVEVDDATGFAVGEEVTIESENTIVDAVDYVNNTMTMDLSSDHDAGVTITADTTPPDMYGTSFLIGAKNTEGAGSANGVIDDFCITRQCDNADFSSSSSTLAQQHQSGTADGYDKGLSLYIDFDAKEDNYLYQSDSTDISRGAQTNPTLMATATTGSDVTVLANGDDVFASGDRFICYDETEFKSEGVVSTVTPTTILDDGSATDLDKVGVYAELDSSNSEYFDGGDIHDIANQDIAVSLWFKRDGNPNNVQILLSRRSGGGNGYDFKLNTDGVLIFTIDDGAEEFISYGISTYLDNKWHHIMAFIDRNDGGGGNSYSNLYIDGYSKASADLHSSSNSLTNSANFNIGARSGSDTFGGSIKDVRIWYVSDLNDGNNGASQALELATNPLGSSVTFNTNSEYGWWEMTDSASSATLADSSGNGNTLDLQPTLSPDEYGTHSRTQEAQVSRNLSNPNTESNNIGAWQTGTNVTIEPISSTAKLDNYGLKLTNSFNGEAGVEWVHDKDEWRRTRSMYQEITRPIGVEWNQEADRWIGVGHDSITFSGWIFTPTGNNSVSGNPVVAIGPYALTIGDLDGSDDDAWHYVNLSVDEFDKNYYLQLYTGSDTDMDYVVWDM